MEHTTVAREQKTYPVLPVATPDTIVLWCGDPRFQEAVGRFIEDDLGLKHGQYVPLTLAGGVASLSEPMSLPKEFKYLKETIEFFLGHFQSINSPGSFHQPRRLRKI